MIYYAVAYMKDGQIHAKPFASKEVAEEHLEKLMKSKWAEEIEFTQIVKKDTSTSLWKRTNGHWLGA